MEMRGSKARANKFGL